MAAGEELVHVLEEGVDFSGPQQVARLIAPAGTACAGPMGAGIGEGAEVLHGVIEVDQLNHGIRPCEGVLFDQSRESGPDPPSAVGDPTP
jgi:hypothetical protein